MGNDKNTFITQTHTHTYKHCYVTVCRFSAVHYLIIVCFSLFSNYSTYVFNIIFMFVVCFVFLFPLFVYSVFFIVLYTVSAFVYSCLFPIFVQVYRPLPPGENPVCLFLGATAPQWARASSITRFLVGRTPLDEWSSRHRDFYLTTHTINKRPCLGGIRTHNLSRRAVADPRLRPRGHWDWLETRLQ